MALGKKKGRAACSKDKLEFILCLSEVFVKYILIACEVFDEELH